MRTMRLSGPALIRLFRYYQVGLLNTVVGFGLFSILVAVGLNIYVAQIIGHVLGVTFNYFSYSQHVFKDASPSKPRFILSYALNYFVGLASLAAAASVIQSPYVAGGIAVLFASFLNFLVLRNLVFTGLGTANLRPKH